MWSVKAKQVHPEQQPAAREGWRGNVRKVPGMCGVGRIWEEGLGSGSEGPGSPDEECVTNSVIPSVRLWEADPTHLRSPAASSHVPRHAAPQDRRREQEGSKASQPSGAPHPPSSCPRLAPTQPCTGSPGERVAVGTRVT